jgi:hypothetical protein
LEEINDPGAKKAILLPAREQQASELVGPVHSLLLEKSLYSFLNDRENESSALTEQFRVDVYQWK